METAPEPWEREIWVDEGPVREAASRAVRRGSASSDRAAGSASRPRAVSAARATPPAASGAAPAAARTSGPGDARSRERITLRVEEAERAFARERYGDVVRMMMPIVQLHPETAAAQELLGLSQYRLGRWRAAAKALEAWRELTRGVEHLAVLADCYRALRRYRPMEEVWTELREASPSAALVAEGRIVVAGSLADRGDVRAALDLMARTATVPRRVRDHHLRSWYVLGDLHDRAGDAVQARHFFERVAQVDPEFADVTDRLRALGR